MSRPVWFLNWIQERLTTSDVPIGDLGTHKNLLEQFLKAPLEVNSDISLYKQTFHILYQVVDDL